ncbi:MAG: citrate transporter [Alphaproteobacteria bacterium]|nr:citrate transporter [Alphaproteobacteria bacterium]
MSSFGEAALAAAVGLRATPVEFVIFGLTLAGVAVFHRRPLLVALTGLAATGAYKLLVTGFAHGPGLAGLTAHAGHEAVLLGNLGLLLTGFALMASQFERSNIPEAMPRILPDGWTGGLALLGLVFAMSIFLDNIAAAVIGAVTARHVFHDKVGVGYLAAIVAAANAGGAGSVLGDTTTTMMWISGVSPLAVLKAFVAAGAALLVFGLPAAIQQHRYAPIQKHVPAEAPRIDRVRAGVVVFILLTLLAVNFAGNAWYPQHQDRAPWLGLSLWAALILTAPIRLPKLSVLGGAIKSALFLTALVATASLMPVDRLPEAGWRTAFGLGVLSSVFDNIPLTALALKQGGYDWGILAFAVGFGGSMMWFGSSAGVAVSTLFPKTRSVGAWLRRGWYVPIAYVAGFAVMLHLTGWTPSPTRAERPDAVPVTPPAVLDDALHRAGEAWRGLIRDLGDRWEVAVARPDPALFSPEPKP